MSRLGTWKPDGFAGRIDRLESLAQIRQLAQRYALAIDSRDIDALVALFVPDVRIGRDASGRAALAAWFRDALSGFRTSIHFVGNHIVDFDGPDDAHGIVYCRDELDYPDRGEWQVGVLQYWDTYRRIEGEWCFSRRKFLRWYVGDALTRPAHGLGMDGEHQLNTTQLPEVFDTWHSYWSQVKPDANPALDEPEGTG